MNLVRDVMHCKPGHVRPMVAKFKQIGTLFDKLGFKGTTRILTDVAGERYWTVVFEREVDDIGGFAKMMERAMSDPQFQNVMKDYHELVESGRREIYTVE